MRKKGLQKTYQQLARSEAKTKIAPVQTEDNKKQLKKTAISEQIMITPYAISQEFNPNEAKLEKIAINKLKLVNKTVQLSSLKTSLPLKQSVLNFASQKVIQSAKTVDLSNIKYNIECHLGTELKSFCLKEGFKIITNKNQDVDLAESNEQNTTLVQYYLKEFTNPELSSQTILSYIEALIN